MNIFYSILLGIVQGITEFLPISSSGHLALAEHYLGLEEATLTFDVALHLGTLVAILIYFRMDFIMIAQAFLTPGKVGNEAPRLRKVFYFICLGTIPGVLAGLFLHDIVESFLRQPLYIAMALGVVALLMLAGERMGAHRRDFHTLTVKDAIIIGLAQAAAIVPGVSRSGITMTAGLFRGLNRQAVARFSFLLSAPIIFGAGVYKIPEIINHGLTGDNFANYIAGFLSAVISGYISIAFLLRYIRTRTFDIFAYYRFGLACVVFAVLLLQNL